MSYAELFLKRPSQSTLDLYAPVVSADNQSKKPAAVALLVAGVALIVLGTGGALALGILGFQGAVSIMEAHLITFTVKSLALAIAAFAGGIFGGFGCLIAREQFLAKDSLA